MCLLQTILRERSILAPTIYCCCLLAPTIPMSMLLPPMYTLPPPPPPLPARINKAICCMQFQHALWVPMVLWCGLVQDRLTQTQLILAGCTWMHLVPAGCMCAGASSMASSRQGLRRLAGRPWPTALLAPVLSYSWPSCCTAQANTRQLWKS